MNKRKIFLIIISLLPLIVLTAKGNQKKSDLYDLPTVETLIIKPMKIENIDIWVPAVKTGPIINRSCQVRRNCSFSSIVPASVVHTKTQLCPDALARLLAEYSAPYHEQSLPLTIMNGWQWEYLYSLSQFETVNYDLADHGGSWENCWEAILTASVGSAESQWIQIADADLTVITGDKDNLQTNININSFNSMRIRDGYPKIRILE